MSSKSRMPLSKWKSEGKKGRKRGKDIPPKQERCTSLKTSSTMKFTYAYTVALHLKCNRR